MYRRFILIVFFAFSITLNSIAGTEDIKVIKDLLNRIAPAANNHIVFELLPKEKDCFEIETVNKKVVIRGNNSNSMATGLNYYLKYYCLTNVSWYAADDIVMPKKLPFVDSKVTVEAKVKNRFFLNYCTFGYTMPWWNWSDWERLIDWMALNGINLPLAITGQETVWYEVWKKMGMTDEQIRAYFTGPAHLPWHRMSNLDYWQGNLPMQWLKTQKELQQKIVKRERELGMKPVLPAFSGHVPKELALYYPESHITQMSSWGGFQDQFRSHFLDPLDPLFKKIQKEFLTVQTELFGTDHIYGADPFNEVESPSWEPSYLATVSKSVYESITDVDPEATWLQMTWVFYHDRKHWTNPRIEAFLKAVPQDKMLLLDYYCENTEIWRMTDKYFNQPYIWCYLGNFGGNTMLAGNLHEVGRRIDNALNEGGDNLWGIGSTLEALDVNPIMYEYVFEKAWNTISSDKDWIDSYADCRIGKKSDLYRDAWQLLADSIYTTPSRLGQGCMTNSRPSMDKRGKWVNHTIKYQNETLMSVWKMMIDAGPIDNEAYYFDLVNIGRQILGNQFYNVRNSFSGAYNSKNLKLLTRKGDEMIEILDDLEELLGSHSTFLLGKWLDNAQAFGRNKSEKDYYTHNAKTILTTWGEQNQSLNDYANRQWNGLISSYYKPRWTKFIEDSKEQINDNSFDISSFNNFITDWEWNWTLGNDKFITKPKGCAYNISKRLFAKYKHIEGYPVKSDSIKIAEAEWLKLDTKDNTAVYSLQTNLFGSEQTISMIRISSGSNIKFRQMESCMPISEVAKQQNAKAAINGSFYNVKTCRPTTFIKIDGNHLGEDCDTELYRVNAAILKDKKGNINIMAKETLTDKIIEKNDIVSSGPLLVDNFMIQNYTMNSGFYKRNPRTAIGKTKKGEIIFIVVDGRFPGKAEGMTISELAFLMKQLGCEDAINLDGGGSSALWYEKLGIISHPCDNKTYDKNGERSVSNLILLF